MDTLIEVGIKSVAILFIIAITLNFIAYMDYMATKISKTNEILSKIEEKLNKVNACEHN